MYIFPDCSIGQDSYRGNPWQPWTQNLYAYAGSNPVNYIDPTGHFGKPVLDVGVDPDCSNNWCADPVVPTETPAAAVSHPGATCGVNGNTTKTCLPVVRDVIPPFQSDDYYGQVEGYTGGTAGGFHYGVDFGTRSETPVPVVAVMDGWVISTSTGCPLREDTPAKGDPNAICGNDWLKKQYPYMFGADTEQGNFGNTVVIQHAGGSISIYTHLNAGGVTVGQKVVAGQQIGIAGSTGYANGPHLHLEWWRQNSRVIMTRADPLDLFSWWNPVTGGRLKL